MDASGTYLISGAEEFLASPSAAHLIDQRERLVGALASGDPPLVLDTAKAFLETIFKTILSDRTKSPNHEQDMMPLCKDVMKLLPVSSNKQVERNIEQLLKAVVHNSCELRNHFGAASHGDDAYFDNPVTFPESLLVARLCDSAAAFLYRKHKTETNVHTAARIHYEDHMEFNDFLDEQYPPYILPLGDGQYFETPASEFIFKMDKGMYHEMLMQYSSTEAVDDEIEIQEDTEP